MGNALNLSGRVFGRLKVISRTLTPGKQSHWLCECQCGNTRVVRGTSLTSGHTKSCGCLHDEASAVRISEQNKKHGKRKTRLYSIWSDMKKRCNNEKHWAFSNYGGRGITVCKEWQEFLPFYEWAMRNDYRENLTIDRIDNDGNYEPGNCRWVTRKVQGNNKSNNIVCVYNGKKYTITQLSEKTGVPRNTLYSRICTYKWDVEKAVSAPIKGR